MGLGVGSVVELRKQGSSDADVLRLAEERGETLLTLDLDMGQLFVEKSPRCQVVLVRVPDARPEALNIVLREFLAQADLDSPDAAGCLFIVRRHGYRLRPRG